MEKKLANVISVLLHPLLIPSYMLLLFLNSNYLFSYGFTFEIKIYLFAFVVIMTVLLPGIVMVVLKKTGIIQSVKMHNRDERMLPLAIMSVIYYITYYSLNRTGLLNVFNLFLLGITLLSLFTLLTNFYTKISLHMIAMGGITGTVLGLALVYPLNMTTILYVLFIISGITAYARLTVSNHTLRQVYNGFMVGFTVMFALFVL